MPTLSVCMMVQNVEKTLEIALESLDRVYDELIIVDGGSNDKTCQIATSYGAKIIHSPWPGNHSQQRNVYLKEVKTDWVFVLDSIVLNGQPFIRYHIEVLKQLPVTWHWHIIEGIAQFKHETTSSLATGEGGIKIISVNWETCGIVT